MMSKIKLKLFINVLPDDDTIPCLGMDYSVVEKGKGPDEPIKFPVQKKIDHKLPNPQLDMKSILGQKGKPIAGQGLMKNLGQQESNSALMTLLLNRKGKTDIKGFTKEMDLPIGDYDLWIKRSDSKWEKATNINGNSGIQIKSEWQGTKTLDYQIKQYYRYKIEGFRGTKLSENISFETFSFDKDGKEKKISLPNVKVNVVDKNGFTPPLYSPKGEVIFVKFKFLNRDIQPDKKDIQHFATLSPKNYVTVQLKAVAEVTKKPKDTIVAVQGSGKPPVILNMHREEMIVLSAEDYAEFEKESSKLDKLFGNSFEAKNKLAEAIKSGSVSNVKKAEEEIKEAEKKIEEELNKNFKKAADLTEVVTFEARQKKNPNGNTQEFDFRRRYLRTDRYMQLQQKKKNKESFKVTVLGTELKKLKDVKQDFKKISEQAIHNEFKKVSLDLAKYSKQTGTKVWDFSAFSAGFVEQIKLSDSLTVDIQSQWLRCVGGAGLSSSVSWKPESGEVSAKANVSAQGKLVLFEGKAKANYVIPCDKGWMLNFEDIDLGAFRFVIGMELYGFAGAKVAAGIGLEVSYSKDGQQQLAANGRRNRNPSLANNMGENRPRFVPMDRDETIIPGSGANAQGQIEAFAGAEAGIKPSGEFQWLSPEEKEFKSLATLAVDFAVSAGLGAGVNFKLFYWLERNEFRFRAKAALCVGLGAKGALDFAINAGQVIEVLRWVHYQLTRARFTVLGFIAEEAFTNISQMAVIALGSDSPTTKILVNISDEFIKFNQEFSSAKKSVDLANRIKRQPVWVKAATPDAKGMLIYQMTRHSEYTHAADTPKTGISPFLPTHKEAVLAIFETIATEGEWFNVLQRISIRGIKSEQSIKSIEKQLLIYLHDGLWSRTSDFIKEYTFNSDTVGRGSEYVERYEKLRSKIVKTIPLHEKAPMNNPRELKKLREKMIEQPSIINADALVALNTETVPSIEVDGTEAELFIAANYEQNSDGSYTA
ncbi:ATPase [Acinetobacter courvalinii]|uniref:ATPase n=1 Tax=Acinetobacter courvalinii TaxID=280147 RepID=UPI0021CEC69B|nr:ATPase [Acinetobacter courvalinii]MCU4641226.1 ATPase [Acinetobacter courvalinii]